MAPGFRAPQFELCFLWFDTLKQFGFPYVPRKFVRSRFTYFRFPSGKSSCFLLMSVYQLFRRALIGLVWVICPPPGMLGYAIDSLSTREPCDVLSRSLFSRACCGEIADYLPSTAVTWDHTRPCFRWAAPSQWPHRGGPQTKLVLPDEGFLWWALTSSRTTSTPPQLAWPRLSQKCFFMWGVSLPFFPSLSPFVDVKPASWSKWRFSPSISALSFFILDKCFLQ